MRAFCSEIKLRLFHAAVCICIGIQLGYAQSPSLYIFSPSQGTFTYLSGANTITGSPTPSLPIGFSFNFGGTNYTTLKAFDMGYIIFSGLQPNIYPLWLSLQGVGTDDMDGSLGSKSYQTTGTSPNQVFTFEWRNWRWLAGDSANISFQVKLYETSNVIEFCYKEEKGGFGGYSDAFASIGIGNNSNTDFLSLNSALPIPIASSSVLTNVVGCRPATNCVYRFTPPIPCTGAPDPGNIAASNPWYICSGNPIALIDTGYSTASDLEFQWQASLNSTTWNDIAGATEYYYNAVVSVNTYYRLKVTCVSSSISSYTASVLVDVSGALVYNSLPYFQDFENWQSHCDLLDVPGTGWNNPQASFYGAWKRDDQFYFFQNQPLSSTLQAGSYSAAFSGYWQPIFVPNYSNGNHSAFYPNYYGQGPSDLDLYLDCSQQSAPKGLFFDYINRNITNTVGQTTLGLDSLIILMSNNGGASFTRLAGFTTDTTSWERKYVPILSSSATTVIRFRGEGTGSVLHPIGIDSVSVLPSCNGSPVAGIITPAGVVSACAGAAQTLNAVGYSMAGDINYQWEYSTDNGNSWTGMQDFNSFTLHIPALYDTTLIRLKVTCNGSGQSATSNIVTFNVATPAGGFASLPFIEDFESWIDQCDSADVPGVNGATNWANPLYSFLNPYLPNPLYSYLPWRRSDAFAPSGIFVVANGSQPAFMHGSYSAVFGGTSAPPMGRVYNNFDLLLDCSPTGQKKLQFFLDNMNGLPDSSLMVFISSDGGISFSKLYQAGSTNGWELKHLPIVSNSSKAVIRLTAYTPFGSGSGIAVDYLKVLSPCNGQPTAGVVDSVAKKICPGAPFYLSLTGATQSSELLYQWQRSSNGTNWNSISGATTESYQYSVTASTYFRCIIACNASNLADTTPARYFALAPFYYCYCSTVNTYLPAPTDFINIGFVRLRDVSSGATILSTGDSTVWIAPGAGIGFVNYTDYMDVPTTVYRDSSYLLKVSMVHSLDTGWGWTIANITSAFIDYNRDGVYDPMTEQVYSSNYSSAHPLDSGYIIVPSNAGIGLTGMRLIMKSGYGNIPPQPAPCDYNYAFGGEVEDYLLDIAYAPCTGPANAGLINISENQVTSGDTVTLVAFGHDNPDSAQVSQLLWVWQSSADSISWTNIPGSEKADSISQVLSATTWFRLVMICQNSQDTTYSNVAYANVIQTRVSSVPGAENLQLYPNPTTGRVSLKYLGAASPKMTISIFNLAGTRLLSKEFDGVRRGFSAELDISYYPKGVYLFQTVLGSRQFNTRVILK